MSGDRGGYAPFENAIRVFRDGWLAVAIFKNDYREQTYYDSVIFRRIRLSNRYGWVRGANMKHEDLKQLVPLLHAASEWIGQNKFKKITPT